jgi:hypothetical protein
MIGMHLKNVDAGVSGIVDAVAVHPDGLALARIADRWFDVNSLVGVDA